MTRSRRRRPSKSRRASAKPAVWGSWWAWAALGVLAAAVVLGIVAGGGSGGGAGDQAAGTTHEHEPGAVEAGRQLYEGTCAACHGADLNGTDLGPPFLSPIYAPNHHADEAFQRAVLAGVQPHHWDFGPMPAVAGLSRDDVENIVAYVRTQQEAAGIFRDPSHP